MKRTELELILLDQILGHLTLKREVIYRDMKIICNDAKDQDTFNQQMLIREHLAEQLDELELWIIRNLYRVE